MKEAYSYLQKGSRLQGRILLVAKQLDFLGNTLLGPPYFFLTEEYGLIPKRSTVLFGLRNHLNSRNITGMANLAPRQYIQNYSGIFSPNPAFFALTAAFMAHDMSPLTFIRSIIFFINIE